MPFAPMRSPAPPGQASIPRAKPYAQEESSTFALAYLGVSLSGFAAGLLAGWVIWAL